MRRSNKQLVDINSPAAIGMGLLAVLGVMCLFNVVAMLLGAVMRSDVHGKLELEARTLTQVLALAAAEARYAGRALAWTADDSGYAFWQQNAAHEWVQLRDGERLHARRLPPGIRIAELELDSKEVQGVKRIEFAAYGAIPQFAVGLMLDSAQYQVTATAVGSFTAFPVDTSKRETLALR